VVFGQRRRADLTRAWQLGSADIGRLTNAVQLGFILGTLGAAISGLADRYAASRIFAVAALAGALANAGFALFAANLEQALAWRFAVGLCLAGIYPIGMKLVVSWAPERAGQTLAWLVGMLTFGTALPHGLRALDGGWPWQQVVLASSVLAVIAAAAIFRLGDGPHLKPRGKGQASPSAMCCMPSRYVTSAPRPAATSATCGSCMPSGP
jgi:MFS family permease